MESFIGIRVPVLRKFAKEFTKEAECKDFLHQLPHEYYDENMLHGLLISEAKDYEECIRLTDSFLPFVDNWAVCDIMSPKVFAKHKKELLAKIKTWSKSSHVYTYRFGIETLMSHYLDKDFKAEYLEIPASVRSEEYYVKDDGSLVLRHRPCQAMGRRRFPTSSNTALLPGRTTRPSRRPSRATESRPSRRIICGH